MKNKIILSVISVVLVLLFAVWGYMFTDTQKNKIQVTQEIYSMGEAVELGNNFHIDKKENSDGYVIRVNSLELVDYAELNEKYGVTNFRYETGGKDITSKYAFLLNMTVTNKDNQDGYLFVMNYGLFNDSLKLDVDYSLWQAMDKNYDGAYSIRIYPGTSADINIVFIPNGDMILTDVEEVYKRMKNESFYFNLTDYPVRKIVEVHL